MLSLARVLEAVIALVGSIRSYLGGRRSAAVRANAQSDPVWMLCKKLGGNADSTTSAHSDVNSSRDTR